jgi:FkbM family methyltransferase
MSERYYSQHGQDQVLDKLVFKQKRAGIFLDIGANDGVTYSNTYFLEKERGWGGLCVEPLPSAFEKLKAQRSCKMENCAVGSKDGKDVLLEITGYSEMLSGLKKNYHKDHLGRIDQELSSHGGNKREIEITVSNVNNLLRKHALVNVDYCNIDTEGSETEILNAIDFKKIRIDVITVEANYRIERWRIKFRLYLNGYRYIANLGSDMLFVHKRFLENNRELVREVQQSIVNHAK